MLYKTQKTKNTTDPNHLNNKNEDIEFVILDNKYTTEQKEILEMFQKTKPWEFVSKEDFNLVLKHLVHNKKIAEVLKFYTPGVQQTADPNLIYDLLTNKPLTYNNLRFDLIDVLINEVVTYDFGFALYLQSSVQNIKYPTKEEVASKEQEEDLEDDMQFGINNKAKNTQEKTIRR